MIVHAGDRAGTLRLAERMGRLGAETAFAVSADIREGLTAFKRWVES